MHRVDLPVNRRLIWVDIETTGLNVRDDVILEIGFKITDLELKTVAETRIVLNDSSYTTARENASDFVKEMHTKSGLWGQSQAFGMTVRDAETYLSRWFSTTMPDAISDNLDPLVGSSVHFDRAMLEYHLPTFMKVFSYRNIDVSSFREVAKRYVPSILESPDYPVERKIHRVFPDLEDSIALFKYFSEELF